jgi:hypothetical protein
LTAAARQVEGQPAGCYHGIVAAPPDAAERIRQASSILAGCVFFAEAARAQLPNAPREPSLLRGLERDARGHRELQRALWKALGPARRK